MEFLGFLSNYFLFSPSFFFFLLPHPFIPFFPHSFLLSPCSSPFLFPFSHFLSLPSFSPSSSSLLSCSLFSSLHSPPIFYLFIFFTLSPLCIFSSFSFPLSVLFSCPLSFYPFHLFFFPLLLSFSFFVSSLFSSSPSLSFCDQLAKCPPSLPPNTPPQQKTGRKQDEKGQDKDREIVYQLPRDAKQTRLGEN